MYHQIVGRSCIVLANVDVTPCNGCKQAGEAVVLHVACSCLSAGFAWNVVLTYSFCTWADSFWLITLLLIVSSTSNLYSVLLLPSKGF